MNSSAPSTTDSGGRGLKSVSWWKFLSFFVAFVMFYSLSASNPPPYVILKVGIDNGTRAALAAGLRGGLIGLFTALIIDFFWRLDGKIFGHTGKVSNTMMWLMASMLWVIWLSAVHMMIQATAEAFQYISVPSVTDPSP